MEKKVCRICSEEKSVKKFTLAGRKKDGTARYRTECNKCRGQLNIKRKQEMHTEQFEEKFTVILFPDVNYVSATSNYKNAVQSAKDRYNSDGYWIPLYDAENMEAAQKLAKQERRKRGIPQRGK